MKNIRKTNKMGYTITERINNAELRHFAEDIIDEFGSISKSFEGVKVIDIVDDLLLKKKILVPGTYQAFVETGDIYNKEVATAFRRNILEKGGSDDPMKLYRTFRGGDPNPEALLRKRGFIQ